MWFCIQFLIISITDRTTYVYLVFKKIKNNISISIYINSIEKKSQNLVGAQAPTPFHVGLSQALSKYFYLRLACLNIFLLRLLLKVSLLNLQVETQGSLGPTGRNAFPDVRGQTHWKASSMDDWFLLKRAGSSLASAHDIRK